MQRAAAVLLACCLAACAAHGDVAMLRNGSLLEGSVSRVGDDVFVRSEGSSVRLPAARVAFIGSSAADAFAWRRAQRIGSVPTVDGHVDLADWALTNGLHAEAALELLAARAASPHDRRIEHLEVRLAEALRPASGPREREIPPETPPVVAEAEIPMPRLPSSGVAYFTRRIQPLVLNGCGAGACHGGARPSDAFALDRASLRGVANAGSTRANLRTVLGAIDIGSPSESPLLAAATGPHAGVTPFAGPRRDELVGRLTRWAYEVAAENAETLPPPAPLGAVANTDAGSPAVVAQETGPFRPRDEFDPEIFNRRYRTAVAP